MFVALDHALDGISSGGNEMLRETMTSADFTYAIMEFVQRRTVPGYERMEFDFEPLVKTESNLPNFLSVNRYQRRGGLDDLELVLQKSPPRPGYLPDATKRTLQVWRWAKQFDFSYEAIVNDDLGYFDDMALLMGQAARRTLEKYVSRFYTNAVSIARLTGLGALYSQHGRLTTTHLSEARMAFGQRTDARGEPINAELAYVVYHRGLEDTVRTIQNSTLVPENATNAANVVRSAFVAIKDPYITGTAPNLPWYAFSDPKSSANVIAFVLARMQGRPAPLILRKKSDIEAITSMRGAGAPVDPMLGDFHTGNVVLKVEDVFGTYIDTVTEGNYFDYRGGYYSDGTAA